MSLPVILRPAAEAKIEDAYRWYEAQRPGRGALFLRAVDVCLADIALQPALYAVQYKQAQRALLRRFPYAVLYVVQADCIDVVACFHARRDPRRWRNRL